MKYSTKLSDTVHVIWSAGFEREGRACPATLVISPAFFSFNISWRTKPGFVWTLSAIEALERDFSF